MRKTGLTNAKFLLMLGLITFAVGCDLDFGDCGKIESYRTEQLSAPITAGATLTVQTEVGSITVSGADVTDCNVTAKITTKAHTQQEADELAQAVKIKLEPAGDGLSCRVEKPAKKQGRRAEVAFEITIPPEINLRLESDVGEIKVSNITGGISAQTDVGEIACTEIAGDVELEVDVGNLTAEYRSNAESTFNAKLATDVGNVKFVGPAELSAKVDASTNVGKINTAFPLTRTGKFIEYYAHGTIGEGTATVVLKTDVGNVEIK